MQWWLGVFFSILESKLQLYEVLTVYFVSMGKQPIKIYRIYNSNSTCFGHFRKRNHIGTHANFLEAHLQRLGRINDIDFRWYNPTLYIYPWIFWARQHRVHGLADRTKEYSLEKWFQSFSFWRKWHFLVWFSFKIANNKMLLVPKRTMEYSFTKSVTVLANAQIFV